MFVPGWELWGGFIKIQVFFKTALLVVEWSVSPSEMILALDVLHWKLNHLIGCCAAQPGVVVPPLLSSILARFLQLKYAAHIL